MKVNLQSCINMFILERNHVISDISIVGSDFPVIFFSDQM